MIQQTMVVKAIIVFKVKQVRVNGVVVVLLMIRMNPLKSQEGYDLTKHHQLELSHHDQIQVDQLKKQLDDQPVIL